MSAQTTTSRHRGQRPARRGKGEGQGKGKGKGKGKGMDGLARVRRSWVPSVTATLAHTGTRPHTPAPLEAEAAVRSASRANHAVKQAMCTRSRQLGQLAQLCAISSPQMMQSVGGGAGRAQRGRGRRAEDANEAGGRRPGDPRRTC
jgi:hypothetical protein